VIKTILVVLYVVVVSECAGATQSKDISCFYFVMYYFKVFYCRLQITSVKYSSAWHYGSGQHWVQENLLVKIYILEIYNRATQ